MAEGLEAAVNEIQTQMIAVQAAIEGNSQTNMFKPRPFSGFQNEDVNKWVSRFQRFGKFYHWSNNKKLGAIGILLEGPALAWYQTLPEEAIGTYATLIDEMKRDLGPKTQILFSVKNCMPVNRA